MKSQALSSGNQITIPFNAGKISLYVGVALAIAGLVLMFFGPSPASIEKVGGSTLTIRTSTAGYGLALVIGIVGLFFSLLSYNTLCSQHDKLIAHQASLDALITRVELLAAAAEQHTASPPAYRRTPSPDLPYTPPPSERSAVVDVLEDDDDGEDQQEEVGSGGDDPKRLFEAPSEDDVRAQVRTALGGVPPSGEPRSPRSLGTLSGAA